MTIDERLNKLEDEISEIKKIINHNNQISRTISTKISETLIGFQKQIDQIKTQSTATNVNMGDIFGVNFGEKR